NHLDPHAPAGTPALVDVIDPATDEVTGSIPVGPQPHHIYPVPGLNEAFISHFTGCSLDVVDLVHNTVIGQVQTRFGPRHLTFGPVGDFAYAIDYYSSSLTVIDTANNHTVAEIPTGPNPNYPQLSNDGATVFVVNSGSDTMTVAQAKAPFAVLRTITVGQHPFDLALTPDGTTLVVANAGDDTVSFVDTATLTVRGSASLHPTGTPVASTKSQKRNVRISSDGRYAWVGDQLGAAFSVFDIPTGELATVIPASGGADIFTELTIGPSRGLAITTARYGPTLDVVTPSPPAPRGQITTAPSCATSACATSYPGDTGPRGVGSHQLVTDPTGTRAYISDRPGGAVTVLDLSSGQPRLLTNIPTSYGAYGFPDGITYVWFT
ncbi:MAG: YncE family protein, partial [Acidimicrobiales bacterium]|nr:YncE family protein [Acidimicrobiales bacterium]